MAAAIPALCACERHFYAAQMTFANVLSHAVAPSILVVDDQPEIGPMARDILEPAGYVVLVTSDPLAAIRMARNRDNNIALLLVDVVMPLMDGRELAQRMLAIRPEMKVILMSGYEVSGVAETGWAFLAKPFGLHTLTQKVGETLRRRTR
jgi:two-component system cell cycle sensor histidine kinase/response regulator CckA